MQGQRSPGKSLGTDLNIEMKQKPFYYHELHSGSKTPCALREIGLEGLQQLSLNFSFSKLALGIVFIFIVVF